MIKIKEIFAVPATRSNETKRAIFLCKKIESLGLTPKLDLYGNIMVTKGKSKTYPTFCAHLDTVHDYAKGFNLVEEKGNLYAVDNKGKQVGVGGDRVIVSLLSN